MAKNLKLNIKNAQLAKAAGLDKLKKRLENKKPAPPKPPKKEEKKEPPKSAPDLPEEEVEPPRRIRAKSKSSFAPKQEGAKQEKASTSAPSAPEEKATPKERPAPKPGEMRLGPTGRHVKDLLKKANEQKESAKKAKQQAPAQKERAKAGTKPQTESTQKKEGDSQKDARKGKKVRDFKDVKPSRGGAGRDRGFDARDRAGLRAGEDERWRKRRAVKSRQTPQEDIVRPSSLKIRLPITIKDLAAEMKYKSSELIQKLFLQNMIYTLNDYLEDETIVQYLGQEFECEIKIDTSEEERIKVTSESILEEIAASDPDKLAIRPPVVAFMGHVDHGKTSLIDAIRKSNITSAEAGAITQHIGAFMCHTPVGDLTVLDTPGHEAFSAMRARGAEVTDIVVLVVAGDEGLRDQTLEAIQHAKAAGVTIVVAINKCDKPDFNAENVYRELSEVELLPEAWGGQTITVNTSAVSGEGIQAMLEMLALQAEVMELKADPTHRARGTVLESELHKGMGSVATILVQNGTLNHGDALVFERQYGRVKTMHDEHGKVLKKAGPSHPVEVTGLSGLPAAGDPFIVVKNEKEAKHIVEQRQVGHEERQLRMRKTLTLDNLLEQKDDKKVLNIILRGDVQGSVEALKTSIMKIESDKAEPNVIFTGVGEVSESDVQLAAASNAVILGFHTGIESNASNLIKENKITVRQHDIIYHAVDDIKRMMTGLLDRIEEEKETGKAEVKAIFKSSQLGNIAGCMMTDGMITRNHKMRVVRGGEVIWKGSIASLKRGKEDVKEVKKGFECGIVLQGFDSFQEDDELQAYEIIYLEQEL